jgi:excinuclease UvrABC ATPase subunit
LFGRALQKSIGLGEGLSHAASRPAFCENARDQDPGRIDCRRAGNDRRYGTLYVLDEPTTALHPSDVEKLTRQLHGLVDAGNTVILVEHDMSVAADSDWIIDVGPGAGDEGGRIVVAGPPDQVASSTDSRTAKYLAREMRR